MMTPLEDSTEEDRSEPETERRVVGIAPLSAPGTYVRRGQLQLPR